MSDKKNIEHLFQEKFKDFEANPADEVWGNIEEKLEEKKRRRVIPFWWKLSGVAALLLIGFLITKSVRNSNGLPQNSVVNDLNQQKINTTGDGSEKFQENNSNKSASIDAVVSKATDKTGDSENSSKTNSDTNPSKKTIANRKFVKQNSTNSKSNVKNTNSSLGETVLINSENQIAVNKEKNYSSNSDKTILQTETISNNPKTININDLKTNNSFTAAKEVEKKINDSVVKNSVVTNALEELLNEKESKTKQESKINRWQLISNVAPVFLGSISNGSPIDSILVNNSKSYNTSVGFGLGVSYAVNSKLSVRTGLNKLNMSYNTNDILFFAGLQSRPLKNVSPTASSSLIQIQSNTASNNQNVSTSETTMLPFETTISRKNTGYLNQEIGYLEMPMELTYAIVDKKFGLKVIGGFSTLFLQDNSISIISDNGNTLLGEANNLNNIHFSTNLGLGMKYSFMKSFEFNIEPTLKYQLNTFSSNVGNFKPYIFGIYSGVSYRF